MNPALLKILARMKGGAAGLGKGAAGLGKGAASLGRGIAGSAGALAKNPAVAAVGGAGAGYGASELMDEEGEGELTEEELEALKLWDLQKLKGARGRMMEE